MGKGRHSNEHKMLCLLVRRHKMLRHSRWLGACAPAHGCSVVLRNGHKNLLLLAQISGLGLTRCRLGFVLA
jgi:uncharacterized protein YdeI (YjbR/CyaY-like superfamily)